MAKIGRNDSCWCGSGKKYKKCHLGREREKNIDRGDANSVLKLFTNVSKCSVPDDLKHECERKIVKAHTLSKSNSLKEIAKNGHVLGTSKGFDAFERHNGVLSFDKIGINKASTFTGFCSYHDKMLFSCIEDEEFIANNKQCTMLAYRPLMREFYVKEANLKVVEASRIFDRGWDFQAQLAWARQVNENIEGTRLSLKDLSYIKDEIETSIKDNTFSALKHLIIKLEKPPKVMACGIYAPIVDILGNEIQKITKEDARPEYIITNVLALDGNGYVIFSWLPEDNNVIQKFIASIKKCSRHLLGDKLTNHILSFMENVFASEEWWDSQGDKQGYINELLMQGVRMHVYDLGLISHDYNNYNAITVNEIIEI